MKKNNPAFGEADKIIYDLAIKLMDAVSAGDLTMEAITKPLEAMAEAKIALDQAYQEKFLAEGWIDGRALGRKRYWKVGSCSWCGKSLRRDHSKCETAKAAIKKEG